MILCLTNKWKFYDNIVAGNSVLPSVCVCYRSWRRDGVHEKRLQVAEGRRRPQKAGEVDKKHAGVLHADRFGVEWFVDWTDNSFMHANIIIKVYVPWIIYSLL